MYKENAPFKYDFVGSFLRPDTLKKARIDYAEGKITSEDLIKVENEEITKLIAKQKEAGYHVITDGEFRRSYWHLDFMWGFNGIEHIELDHGYFFHGEETTHGSIKVVKKISGEDHPFVDHFKFVKQFEDENTIAKYKEQHVIQQEISNALADDRVEVFFQPIYSNRDKCFTSAEALVRIRKKDGTLLSPSIFIPVAEKTGIILELGERVIEKVCLLLKNSDAIKLGIHYIEINLSVIQCEKRDLAKRLISIVEKYDIAPGLINLEITETASISARTILLENMKTLINYGFTFSLDDFGKGESNLMYIVEMPVSIVKLDYDMLKAFFRSPKAKTVVQAVVNMAHNMNLKMVAEGIETEEEIQGMSKENIDYIQGYYYSCPVPQNDFLEFLRNNQPVLSSSAE